MKTIFVLFFMFLLIGCKSEEEKIYFILTNGQSLAAGEESSPHVSVVESPFGNYKFDRGIRT